MESNSLDGYFGVAGVDEFTHLVAFYRCNESVGVGNCPGHIVVSHMIFRQFSSPGNVPPVTEAPTTDPGTYSPSNQVPDTNRPQASNASIILRELISVLIVLPTLLLQMYKV